MTSDLSRPMYDTIVESNDPVTQVQTGSFLTRKASWHLFKSWARRLWFDTWFLELMALVISISCGIGIYATLGTLDGQPLPTLPKTLTLNTIIAFLSTVTKSSLILMVSSSIGQLKWKWYQRTRDVQDARLFDDASRGPLGSLQMLLEHRGRSIACLGALILILTLLFDPFTQQAVVYPTVQVLHPSELAKANQSQLLSSDLFSAHGVTPLLQEVLTQAIWSESLNSSDFEPKMDCLSSDCVWKTFTSLGFCTSCGASNPPPHLECDFSSSYPRPSNPSLGVDIWSESKPCTIRFRDGNVYQKFNIELSATDIENIMVSGPDYGLFTIYTGKEPLNGDPTARSPIESIKSPPQLQNDTIQGVQNPLLALAAVQFQLNSTHITIVEAQECAMHFCLRDYTIRQTNNTPDISVSNVRNGSIVAAPFAQSPLDNPPLHRCWIAENETFSVDPQNNIGDESYKCQQMPTNMTGEGAPTNTNINGTASEKCWYTGLYWFDPVHFSFCMNSLYGPYLDWGSSVARSLVGGVSQSFNTSCQSDDLDEPCTPRSDGLQIVHNTIDNTSIGNEIMQTRLSGFDIVMSNIANSLTSLNLRLNGTVVAGQVLEPVTFVHVRWAWLTLPSSLLACGIVLFLYTAIDAKRYNIRIWKSSALAFLYHGLEQDHLKPEGNESVEKVSEMELKAARLKVRLIRDRKYGRTVMATG